MQSHRILIVDDEPHIAAVVALKLRKADLEAVVARDGHDALRLLAEHPFDLIIADLSMPHLDGLALCRRLAADPRTAGIPVIIITGRGPTLEPADLAGANIRAVITKPFSPRDILERSLQLLTAAARADLERDSLDAAA